MHGLREGAMDGGTEGGMDGRRDARAALLTTCDLLCKELLPGAVTVLL